MALDRMIAGLGAGDFAWVGLAAAGWLVALLLGLLAIWQASRTDVIGMRAAEAAHELRNSLCAARLALAGLERAFADAPQVVRAAAAIDLELGRASLALDQLTVSGSGVAGRATELRSEQVDLTSLLRTAEPTWQALAHRHDTSLEVDTGCGSVVIAGDPRRLLQGIGNLIANACEHGRGPVRLTLAGDGRTCRIEVCDGGPGPAAEVVRRARRRASASWVPQRRASLRGHGMAVAAYVAQENGGRLRVAAGRSGAVVGLELPVDRSAGRRRRRPVQALLSPIPALRDGVGRLRAAPEARSGSGRRRPLTGAR